MSKHQRFRRGFTLVETSISLVLFGLIATFVFAMISDSQRLFASAVDSGTTTSDLARTLDRLRLELAQADPLTLDIDEASVSHDLVRLRVPLVMNRDGVVYGASDSCVVPPRSYPDHHVEYLLTPASDGLYRLVRRIVAPGGALVCEEELVDHVDRPGADGKGFDVERTADSEHGVRVALRLRTGAGDASVVRARSIRATLRSRG